MAEIGGIHEFCNIHGSVRRREIEAVEWCVLSECSVAGRSPGRLTGYSGGSSGDKGGEEDFCTCITLTGV